jgi:hypothetical protein
MAYKTTPLFDPFTGKRLTKEYLDAMPIPEREKIRNFLLDVFHGRFPLLRNYVTDDDLNNFYNRLACRDSNDIVSGDIISNVSDNSTILSKIFFPSFFKVCDKSNSPSIYEAFHDRGLLKKMLDNRLGISFVFHNANFSFNLSIQMLYQGFRSTRICANISIFKNIISKYLYNTYCPDGGRVFDYSAGFGNRLLGAMSCNKNIYYVGVEPNTETFNEYPDFIDYFGFGDKCKIYNSSSDDFVIEDEFDFIFSSPPFFDMERYSDEDTQSIIRYPEYNDWLRGYWFNTVENCKAMLKSHGYFGVNTIRDFEEDMCKIIEENGFELHKKYIMKTARSHLTSKSKYYRMRHDEMDKPAKAFKYNESILIYRMAR